MKTVVWIAFAIGWVGVTWAQSGPRKPPNYSQANMPVTSFSCRDKILGGYYADPETDCQMFHVCVKVPGQGIQDYKFLCPNNTSFDQENQICDDWFNIDCEASTLYYSDNFDLYRIGSDYDTGRVSPGVKLPTNNINNAVSDVDDDYLRRADRGESVGNDLLRGSHSSNFFSNKNQGREEDEEPKKKPLGKAGVRKLLTGKRPIAATTAAPQPTQAATAEPATIRQNFSGRNRGSSNYRGAFRSFNTASPSNSASNPSTQQTSSPDAQRVNYNTAAPTTQRTYYTTAAPVTQRQNYYTTAATTPRPYYTTQSAQTQRNYYTTPQEQTQRQNFFTTAAPTQRQFYTTAAPTQRQFYTTAAPTQRQFYTTAAPTQRQFYTTAAPTQRQSYSSSPASQQAQQGTYQAQQGTQNIQQGTQQAQQFTNQNYYNPSTPNQYNYQTTTTRNYQNYQTTPAPTSYDAAGDYSRASNNNYETAKLYRLNVAAQNNYNNYNDDGSSGEFLKTAPSQNLGAANFNRIQNIYKGFNTSVAASFSTEQVNATTSRPASNFNYATINRNATPKPFQVTNQPTYSTAAPYYTTTQRPQNSYNGTTAGQFFTGTQGQTFNPTTQYNYYTTTQKPLVSSQNYYQTSQQYSSSPNYYAQTTTQKSPNYYNQPNFSPSGAAQKFSTGQGFYNQETTAPQTTPDSNQFRKTEIQKTSQKKYTPSVTHSPSSPAPFRNTGNNYVQSNTGNNYVQSNTGNAVSPAIDKTEKPRPFTTTVGPKSQETKEKDQYDYAYYDDATHTEYDSFDGVEFAKTKTKPRP